MQQIFTPQETEWTKLLSISQLGSKSRLVWNPTSNGQFSIKSAYQLIILNNEWNSNRTGSSMGEEYSRQVWNRTQNLKVKTKIKHFLWKCHLGLLPTKDKLVQRGMQIEPICKGCGEAPKTVEHTLLQYYKTALIQRISPVRWDGLHHAIHSFPLW